MYCRINKKQERGLRTLCKGLPPRLIASRRLRLRCLVGDGFAVRIPLFPQKRNEAKDVEKFRHLLFFNTTTHKFIFEAEWWEIKEDDLSTFC